MIKQLFVDFGYSMDKSINIYEDNQNCIKILNDKKSYLRTKHLDVKLKFSQDIINTKLIQIQYCPTEDMLADILTKPLISTKLSKFIKDIGIVAEGECQY